MRPTQVSPGPTDVDESTDTYDTIAWLLASDLRHNGRVGLWGVSYGGFYAAAALPRAHPALKAVSPQAPIADLFLGDDSYHNGAFMLAANFSFYTGFFPRRGGPSAKDDRPPFSYGTQDGYAFYLGLGGLREGERAALPAGQHLLGGQPRASDLRRVLAGARDRAAPARRHAGGADRRRLVRRRGSGRAAAHLSRHRAAEPVRVEPPRDGPVGARRLVARRRRQARRARLRREDRRRVPRALRAAVLRAPPARRAARGRAGGGGLRDRRERLADAAGVAARRGDAAHVLFRGRRDARGCAGSPRRARRSAGSEGGGEGGRVRQRSRTGRCRTCRTRAPACAATT